MSEYFSFLLINMPIQMSILMLGLSPAKEKSYVNLKFTSQQVIAAFLPGPAGDHFSVWEGDSIANL